MSCGFSFQSSRLRTFIFRLRVFSALSLLLQTFCVRVRKGLVVFVAICKASFGSFWLRQFFFCTGCDFASFLRWGGKEAEQFFITLFFCFLSIVDFFFNIMA